MAGDLDYTTGTISVTAGASVIVGVGTSWSLVAEKYDVLVPTGVGHVAVVKTVTDDTHIVPFGGWQGGTLAGVTYTLIKNSVNRFVNADAMQVVIDSWEMLQQTGIIYAVVGVGVLPDVSIGSNGQYAINFDNSPWTFYKKVGGVWVVQSSLLTSNSITVPPQGRLTLQSGVPVMTTSLAAQAAIFYAPYVGDKIPLYNGTDMVPTPFAEYGIPVSDATKSPAAIGVNKINDWFGWGDPATSGSFRISHGPDWTDDTTRSAGTALTRVKGIWLNAVAITNGPAASRGTYVGTTRSNASGQLEWIKGGSAAGGSPAKLHVWNAYNRVSVFTTVSDSTVTWTLSSTPGVLRQTNNSAGNRISFVSGLAEDGIDISNSCLVSTDSKGCNIGFSMDSIVIMERKAGGISVVTNLLCRAAYDPILGFHFIQAMESVGAAGTTIFIGGNAFSFIGSFRM